MILLLPKVEMTLLLPDGALSALPHGLTAASYQVLGTGGPRAGGRTSSAATPRNTLHLFLGRQKITLVMLHTYPETCLCIFT